MIDATTATILGSTLTGLTISVLSYLREGRAHKWAVEQSERDRKERLKTAEELKLQHAEASAHLAQNTRAVGTEIVERIEEAKAKIDENTLVSVQAFAEANNINEKIVAIGEARLRGSAADRQVVPK